MIPAWGDSLPSLPSLLQLGEHGESDGEGYHADCENPKFALAVHVGRPPFPARRLNGDRE